MADSNPENSASDDTSLANEIVSRLWKEPLHGSVVSENPRNVSELRCALG